MFRKLSTIVCLQLLLLVHIGTSQRYYGTEVSDSEFSDGAQKPKKQKTCEDGMKMVQQYLETSKIELIQNIRAAKSAQCKLQATNKAKQKQKRRKFPS